MSTNTTSDVLDVASGFYIRRRRQAEPPVGFYFKSKDGLPPLCSKSEGWEEDAEGNIILRHAEGMKVYQRLCSKPKITNAFRYLGVDLLPEWFAKFSGWSWRREQKDGNKIKVITETGFAGVEVGNWIVQTGINTFEIYDHSVFVGAFSPVALHEQSSQGDEQ